MTTALATSRFRSRFEGPALLLACLLPGACEGAGDKAQLRDPVATIGDQDRPLVLERLVVDALIERGLEPQAAHEHGLAVLRLVAARRAELDASEPPPEHPDALDPARRDQLERAAMVRLWLDEHFEPQHDAASIPRRVIDANMADPSLTRRLFHPSLLFVCQALLVPIETDDEGRHLQPPSEAEAAQAWTAAAEAVLAPVLARVERFESDLLSDGSCELFGRIIGTSEHSFESPAGTMALRYERFAFAPSAAETFDPEWVEKVGATTEPTIIAPFRTQFGLHLVIVGKIEDARLEAGSLPAEQLETAQRAHLREEVEQAWRGDNLQRTLAEVRKRRIVRLSPELERGQ